MSELAEKKSIGYILKRIGINAMWFFFLFGLAGSSYMIIKQMSGKPPSPDEDVDRLVAAATSQLSVMVMRNNHIVYDKDFHWEGEGKPSYALENLDDMLIALATVRLHDQGRIDINAMVLDLIPDASSTLKAVPVSALLTHSSGILPAWSDIPEGVEVIPGITSVYAPLNYILLHRLIVKITEMPVEQYIQGSVLAPLDMENTRWDGALNNWLAPLEDLRKFEEYLNSNRVISLKAHLMAFTAPILADDSRGLFAYGWEVRNHHGLRMERVLGSRGEFNGVVMRFPEKNFAAILLYKGAQEDFDTHAISEELATIYLRREMPLLN